MTLNWNKCVGGIWCPFETVNLDGVGEVSGVYLIWHGGANPRWVRVGQGNIKERLSVHRNDPQILAYRPHGLFVTWAAVPAAQLDGVEAYLFDQCKPLVGERCPDCNVIPVNLPK
jgi:hypothetical protein